MKAKLFTTIKCFIKMYNEINHGYRYRDSCQATSVTVSLLGQISNEK